MSDPLSFVASSDDHSLQSQWDIVDSDNNIIVSASTSSSLSFETSTDTLFSSSSDHLLTSHLSIDVADDAQELNMESDTDRDIIRRIDMVDRQWKRMRHLGQPLTLTLTHRLLHVHDREFSIARRMMEIIKDLILSRHYATKRDVFYKDVSLFQSQRVSDAWVQIMVEFFNVSSRFDLRILATAKGLVSGGLSVEFVDGHVMNHYRTVSLQGHSVPQMELVSDLHLDLGVRFVLVVEKAAIFTHLQAPKSLDMLGSHLLITGKGFPDEQTRRLLHRIHQKYPDIPIWGLMDNDPYGLSIMATYRYGSKTLPDLAVESMQWLGVTCSDWKEYQVPVDALLPLTLADRKRAQSLLSRVDIPQCWKRELQIMMRFGMKAELQALSMFDNRYLLESYLVRKLFVSNTFIQE